MELMQRYLDKDLEEGEHLALMSHIQQCEECAELFARLKHLSSELENLPKVTPSFSLVDAIIPRLAELDLERSERGAAVPAPASSEELSIGRREAKPRRLRDRISLGWIGGVVAAGLALGLFIFNNPQSTRFNADEMLPTANHQKSSTAAGSAAGSASSAAAEQKMRSDDGANAKRAAEPQAAPAAGADSDMKAADKAPASAPPASAAEPKKDMKAGPAANASNNAASPVQNNAAQQAAPPAIGERASGPVASPPAAFKEAEAPKIAEASPYAAGSGGGAAPSVEPSPAGAPAAPPQETPAASASEAPAASDKVAQQMSADSVQDQAGAEAHSFAAVPKAKGIGDSQAAAPMGIAAAPNQAVMASKDGSMLAKVEDRRIVIAGSDGKLLFTSKKQWSESDQVTLVGWTDEVTFTYQVAAAGSVKTYTVNMKTRAEAEKTTSP
ncbi:anti-sigma factor family protein [Paenibacillus thalictri]|nr:zf-HC2 domain-containing protein [Paenibacillus thalictri]